MRRMLLAVFLLLSCVTARPQAQTQSRQFSIQVVAAGSKRLVNLSWTPGPPVACGTVVGYKIYKSTAATIDTMEYLASTATTIYVDQAVTSGHTYFYLVTAYVDSTSSCFPPESNPSNTVSAVIP
jgi:fibronectin type 3 domain-containing protein